MSIVFKITSILFDSSIPKEDQEKWLEENRFRIKFYHIKGYMNPDGYIEYKQFDPKGQKEIFVQVDDHIYAKGFAPKLKIKQNRPTRLGINFNNPELKAKKQQEFTNEDSTIGADGLW